MGAWDYFGYETRGYFNYIDEDTSRTLVAEPGGSYNISPTDPSLAVPPPDGYWKEHYVRPPAPQVTQKAAKALPASDAEEEADPKNL